jgi:hypothetical protein
MMETYRIVRMYKNDNPNQVIKENLSLEEAQEHCRDEETSSSTCSMLKNIEHTRKYGDWFDGYEEE